MNQNQNNGMNQNQNQNENNGMDQNQNNSMEQSQKTAVRSFGNGKFPLIAQNPVPYGVHFAAEPGDYSTQVITAEAFNRILDGVADCGFNCVIFGGSDAEMKSMAKACAKRGETDGNKRLSVILSPEWTGGTSELWSDRMPAFKGEFDVDGWEIMDQPRPHNWELADAGFRKSFDAAKALAPDKIVYYNLAASAHDSWVGDTGCLEGCMSALEELASPSVWSYDLYPFYIESGITESWEPVLSESSVTVRVGDFFRYLDFMRRRSLDLEPMKDDTRVKDPRFVGRPFWAYCMCIAHKAVDTSVPKGTKAYINYQPAPTPGMLRFEAFNALAMGAQGLVFWSYGQFPDSDSLVFGDAPLKRDLSKGSVWEVIRQVNGEIREHEDIFLGCLVVDFAHAITNPETNNSGRIMEHKHFGDTYKDENDESHEISVGCVTKVTVVNGEAGNANHEKDKILNGVLVSDVRGGDGNRYMVFVNRNPFKPVTVNFTTDASCRIIKGNVEIVPRNGGKGFWPINRTTDYKVVIEAGDWVILKWKPAMISIPMEPVEPVEPVYPVLGDNDNDGSEIDG